MAQYGYVLIGRTCRMGEKPALLGRMVGLSQVTGHFRILGPPMVPGLQAIHST